MSDSPRVIPRRLRCPSDYDDVLKIKTRDDARGYIAAAVAEADPDAVRDLETYYLGKRRYDIKYSRAPPLAPEPAKKQFGGDLDDETYLRLYPKELGDLNIKIYCLLELAEGIHDFADERPDTGSRRAENRRLRKYIRESLRAELPAEIPDLDTYANKSALIKEMSAHQYLTFKEGRVENPLHGRDIEAGIYFHTSELDDPRTKAVEGRARFWGPPSAPGTFSSEELFLVQDKKRLVVLKEIVGVRKSMQAIFVAPNLRMMVDQNIVPRDLGEDGLPEVPRSLPHLFTWMTGFECLLDELRELFFYKKYDPVTREYKDADLKHFAVHASGLKFSEKLELVSCDASVYDGSRWLSSVVLDHKGRPERLSPLGDNDGADLAEYDQIDEKGMPFKYKYAPNVAAVPTGEIFHPDGIIRMRFDVPATKHKYGYAIKTTDPYGNPIDFDRPESGRDVIAKIVEGKMSRERVGTSMDLQGTKNYESHSTNSMKKYVMQWSWSDSVGCAGPLAMKRAGDWGQIEHCKRYGIVFVTADKLAALYAAYRDVPFLYLKHHVPKWNDDVQVGTFDGVRTNFVQYSFVMGGDRRSRVALASPEQTGGGSAGLGVVAAAMLAVVVVSSLL